MQKAMKIEHEYKEPKKSKDACEEKKVQETPKMAIICVGSTGTGKSSLINLFCGNQVKVGHGTCAVTQTCSLFTSDLSDFGYWLDSRGANDSSGIDDEKILTDILKRLYDKNVTKIKVVWCVSGDMCREKYEFRTQARFIKSLGNGVWDCCLIIKKNGQPEPNKMDGVLAAASRYGANISEKDYTNLYGYTGVEFQGWEEFHSPTDMVFQTLNKYLKDVTERKHALLECGYLTNAEIVTEVSRKLSKLSSLDIHFENKECSKCGQKGDPRFIYAPCHTDLEKYHPKHIVSYHKEYVHSFHTGSIVHYHSGSEQTSTSRTYHHPGSLERTVFWPDTMFLACPVSFYDKYSCCRGSRGESGCTVYSTHTSSYYSCCGSSSSYGCCEKYGCCNEPVSGYGSSSGCRTVWKCCGTAPSHPGCTQRYECCKKDLGIEGCEIGCEERCRACQNEWGKGPGCVKTSKKESC